MPADQLSVSLGACLAEVRERIALVNSPAVEPVPVPGDDAGNARLRLWLEDAPRLLAAVEAVLAMHRERAGYSLATFCTWCNVTWPCRTARVVLNALLSEPRVVSADDPAQGASVDEDEATAFARWQQGMEP